MSRSRFFFYSTRRTDTLYGLNYGSTGNATPLVSTVYRYRTASHHMYVLLYKLTNFCCLRSLHAGSPKERYKMHFQAVFVTWYAFYVWNGTLRVLPGKGVHVVLLYGSPIE
jgi:hypothetical protein